MYKIEVKNFNLYYTNFHALKNINIIISDKKITAIIGPSGCGKSTFLRSINRINDTIDGVHISGEINICNKNIYCNKVDVNILRKNVGMVFQRPNPFPISIYENIAFGLYVNGISSDKSIVSEIIKKSLIDVLLWDSVKNKLHKSALSLTLEEQQRLCIARVIAIAPHIVLLDEPCSSLDPISIQKIEELMINMKNKYTIVIVTHNMQQAARISDDTAFMFFGKLVEFNETEKMFTNPLEKETEDYISGRF
ncbi:MAG: phosphate ABC transporter ATP-binding protein PstB [Endomicrobium sp.]|jgi:phosphate transport system ATP-binding protein|nr:phosphate ABC transporter ATP-binding protein PstB [Endomicrobium sp.]